ncbi:MAG TPA: hypothetical protein DC049_17440 [Spirochaetia bacterium]|nr:hypothetical protein [Spirochaetia bacterium]
MFLPIIADFFKYLKKPENKLFFYIFWVIFPGLGIYTLLRAVIPPTGSDFAGSFHLAAREVIYGHESIFGKYNYNAYPPLFYCLIAPFAMFTRVMAVPLWYVFSVFILIITVGLIIKILQKNTAETVKIAVPFLLLIFIIADNLYLGQSNFFIVFLAVLAFYYNSRNHEIAAGIALGLAAGLKVTPLFLCLYFLLNGRFKTILFCGITVLVSLFILPGFFFGFRENLLLAQEWLQRIFWPALFGRPMSSGPVSWYHTNQSMEAVLHRFLTDYGARRYSGFFSLISPQLENINNIVFSAKLTVLLLPVLVTLRRKVNQAVQQSLFFLAMIFLPPVAWINHYYALLFPYLVIYNSAKNSGHDKIPGIILISGAVLACGNITPGLQAYGFLFWGNFLIFLAISLLALFRPEIFSRSV